MKYLNPEENFLAIDRKFRYDESEIVILSVPYEHTVSYGGGTSEGPQKIIEASAYVEFYDDEFDSELCFEKGICTLDPLNLNDKFDKEMLDFVENISKKILNDNKFLVTAGGEHTISYAPIIAHLEKYPQMSLLQFDAHSDLRTEYEGSIYSHACVMSRVTEKFPPNRLTQVGIRALCKEESIFIKENKVHTFFASGISSGKYGSNWAKSIVDTLSKEIYISFDVDYFDPSIMPSTGTPEPGGFLYNETLEIFREVQRQNKKIIGFDVVELAPIDGISHPDLTTARLIYKMLNFAFNNKYFNQ